MGALLLAGSMGGLLVILPAAGGTVAPFSLVPALFSAGLGMGLAASSLLGAVLASVSTEDAAAGAAATAYPTATWTPSWRWGFP